LEERIVVRNEERDELVKKEEASTPGELLHTKHAFPPNNLGYCGPDTRGKILDHLHDHSIGESLLSILTKFEAAYPFVKMIANATGRKPFDYEVAEAYWLGNPLLDSVKPIEFFEFTHKGLNAKLSKSDTNILFKQLGAAAKPHHTFYVMGMYSRPAATSASREKLLQLMDSCRISWGRVVEVKEKELIVERSPLSFAKGEEEHLLLSRPIRAKIAYDRAIAPFDAVSLGDWVSLHWSFASERLTSRQVRNLRTYTLGDIKTTNMFMDLLKKNGSQI
jgi:Family of unknown function (DUF6390)